jgi:hypothetical protein
MREDKILNWRVLNILYRIKFSLVIVDRYFMFQYCHVYGLCVTYRRVLDWMIGLTFYTHNSELQAITALSLIYTLYSSLLHMY